MIVVTATPSMANARFGGPELSDALARITKPFEAAKETVAEAVPLSVRARAAPPEAFASLITRADAVGVTVMLSASTELTVVEAAT